MRIDTPLSEVAPSELTGRRDRGMKYLAVYEAAIAAKGLWVPVEFDTKKEAHALYNAARGAQRESRRNSPLANIETKRRGLVIYLRCKPALQAVAG